MHSGQGLCGDVTRRLFLFVFACSLTFFNGNGLAFITTTGLALNECIRYCDDSGDARAQLDYRVTRLLA